MDNSGYDFADEQSIRDQDVNFSTLYAKNQRIQIALTKIDRIYNVTIPTTSRLAISESNFGSNSVFLNLQRSSLSNSTQLTNKPEFCRETNLSNYFRFFWGHFFRKDYSICFSIQGLKKHGCIGCKEFCSLTIQDLSNSRFPSGQKLVQDELSLHGHPKYRIMSTKLARNTNESRLELIEHYKFAHKMK